MGFVGIKVASTDFNAAIVKTIRKYRNIPIAEVKDLVQDNDYLFTCSYVDPDGINMLLQIYHDFCNVDIQSIICENDSVTSVQKLNNWLSSHGETVKQVEEDLDNESLAEG